MTIYRKDENFNPQILFFSKMYEAMTVFMIFSTIIVKQLFFSDVWY
jgi:hypothetical protein